MFLLDTNVASELTKVASGKADPNVAAWVDGVAQVTLFLSAITALELETGVLLMERRDPLQGAHLRKWLDDHVFPAFHGRIIPVDTVVARECAKLRVPSPRPYADTLIAATALVHRLTIVTRSVGDFAPTGVAILNPWEAKL